MQKQCLIALGRQASFLRIVSSGTMVPNLGTSALEQCFSTNGTQGDTWWYPKDPQTTIIWLQDEQCSNRRFNLLGRVPACAFHLAQKATATG